MRAIGFHPVLVIVRPLAQRLLADLGDADDLAEEVDHQLGPRQRRQIAVNDNPIEAVIDEDQELAEQLGEDVHPLRPPQRSIQTRPGKAMRNRPRLRLADEIRSIQRRAAAHDGRVVTVDQLVLFSTETGDAWLLDPSDRLAARLARDGDPEPIAFEETGASFQIAWPGSYRLDGPAFVYTDRHSRRVSTILGYPTQLLAAAQRR